MMRIVEIPATQDTSTEPVTARPPAPPEVSGLLNLRFRVATTPCLRRRLGLSARARTAAGMAFGPEQGGETAALNVDARLAVGEPAPMAA
ncbi:hypothetical protein LRS73_32360 (plasmid) [Methylobacterium currus]|uniref:hypothetical protein n=1 Tax=Methylobacterium currus TaxID=2051553 RepID=UPI001E5B5EE1|nr:hypothetical protein [Methylobacterium currus]UHC20059.1 hypothetical protein LRS73_32360 [Methylobacterium currus]